jgi:hypothetical protein
MPWSVLARESPIKYGIPSFSKTAVTGNITSIGSFGTI